jgi:hypothetical protein
LGGIWRELGLIAGPAGLVELICIYGYALTIFIPAALFCIVRCPHRVLAKPECVAE